MTKKQIMDEKILQHGLRLKRIFGLGYDDIGPVSLCKALRRIETKLHRVNENYCNGIITDEAVGRADKNALKKLDELLGYKTKGIPVVLNGDPRGYALKIADDYVRLKNLEIYKDWGGYGILAPDFRGE